MDSGAIGRVGMKTTLAILMLCLPFMVMGDGDCGDAREMVADLDEQREFWRREVNDASHLYLDGKDASHAIHKASLTLNRSAYTVRCFCPDVSSALTHAASAMRLVAVNLRRRNMASVEVEQQMVSFHLAKADIALLDCPAYTAAAST